MDVSVLVVGVDDGDGLLTPSEDGEMIRGGGEVIARPPTLTVFVVPPLGRDSLFRIISSLRSCSSLILTTTLPTFFLALLLFPCKANIIPAAASAE